MVKGSSHRKAGSGLNMAVAALTGFPVNNKHILVILCDLLVRDQHSRAQQSISGLAA
jgi:hypothetical protein